MSRTQDRPQDGHKEPPKNKEGAHLPFLRQLIASLRTRQQPVQLQLDPRPPTPQGSAQGPAQNAAQNSAQNAAPRLLSGPASAGPPYQASFLQSDGPRAMAMKDFIARFQQLRVKQGIRGRDPLAPVLEMLGEMLVHFTHLFEDLTASLSGHVQRLVAEFRTATEQARGLLAEQARAHERAIAQSTKRMEDVTASIAQQRVDLMGLFARDTEALFKKTVFHQTRVRIWADRTIVVVVVAILAGSAYWMGRDSGLDQARAEIRAAQTRMETVLLRQGPTVANQWIDLADWNDLRIVDRTCAPQASGNAYRLACSYTLWSAPPVQTPPKP